MVGSRTGARSRRPVRGLSVVLTATCLAGCDAITGGRSAPEEARVRLESVEVTEARTVTSTLFAIQGAEVELLTADSQTMALPFEDVFELGSTQRFYVLARADSAGMPSLRMRVWIDGKAWYDEARVFGVDSLQALEFIYRYSEAGPG